MTAGSNPAERAAPVQVRDDDDYIIAFVRRRRNEAEGLDYVSIYDGADNTICVPVSQVPEFLRAVMRAAAEGRQ